MIPFDTLVIKQQNIEGGNPEHMTSQKKFCGDFLRYGRISETAFGAGSSDRHLNLKMLAA